MSRPALLLLLASLAAAACSTWSPQPVVPVQRAFAGGATPDVAVRLVDDSTRWWRIRQARLVGDSIVGQTRTAGQLHHAAVALDDVELLVVRERDQDIDAMVGQMCGFVALLASIWLLARGHL